MLCNVTLDQSKWTAFQPKVHALLDALPAMPVVMKSWSPTDLPAFEGLTIPASVNYVQKGQTLRSGLSDARSLLVIPIICVVPGSGKKSVVRRRVWRFCVFDGVPAYSAISRIAIQSAAHARKL
jgi:hypothetical protein